MASLPTQLTIEVAQSLVVGNFPFPPDVAISFGQLHPVIGQLTTHQPDAMQPTQRPMATQHGGAESQLGTGLRAVTKLHTLLVKRRRPRCVLARYLVSCRSEQF